MKNVCLALITVFLLNSCKKTDPETATEVSTSSTEVSQTQKPVQMVNSAGEEITVTYFAEGPQVAVKIQKAGQPEEKLSAKTTSSNGNPVFTNDNYMWEITQEGKGGRLSDKDGNGSEYKEP
ncbi:hypothetical protein [Kaistella palustris]|uniref:hypothetical protein n=1 Tax=Kaistella palustris TaxID=493376 RepID=UPI000424B1A8|nr:hypothetical protein [Kaistella palustris]